MTYLWVNLKPDVLEKTKSLRQLAKLAPAAALRLAPSQCINNHEDDLVEGRIWRATICRRAISSEARNKGLVGEEANGKG